MMNVFVSPDPEALPADLGFALMSKRPHRHVGGVGRSFREQVRRMGVVPSPVAWDFAILALAVSAADHGCQRARSADGWTRQIKLTVSVVDPAPWQPQLRTLEEALGFLTGDLWCLSVIAGGPEPLPRTNRVRRARVDGDCVSLLSGGLDSLIGAIDLCGAGREPVFVSQRARGDTARQGVFARAVGRQSSHVQLSHAAIVPGRAERSQRARSMGFLAFGALAGSSLQAVARPVLYVPENGYISYNVPLTTLRIGSLSTRTTHPRFLNLIQGVWNQVGLEVEIQNPYQHKTKGEMLRACSNQGLLSGLAASSTSCGRFGTYGYSHCGRCLPCLVRRASFISWGHHDATEYRFTDLRTQACFTDVRSVALACVEAEAIGVRRWSSSSMRSSLVDDVDDATALVGRGLQELRQLLEEQGVL